MSSEQLMTEGTGLLRGILGGPAAWLRHHRIALLILLVSGAAGVLLFAPTWTIPSWSDQGFWNSVVIFAITAVLCDAWFLKTPFANTHSSIAFVPLFAAVLLFPPPIPILMSGVTAVIGDTLIRRKPAQRTLFNTAQYMVSIAVGGLAYTALGGPVGISAFTFSFVPFVALVLSFFAINQGSVALVVALSNGITIRESWDRIGGGARVYDILASSLSILLVYLYVKLQLAGVAVLVVPLFLVRQLYQMNQLLQQELEEKLELMVKAIEARDPYTSGHSRRVAEYAGAIARDLQLSTKQVASVKRAALLHDVGKIYEEFAPLLRKEDKLSAEERMVMETHVKRSAELVAVIARLRGPVLEAIQHHHENYDGTGYPDGLSGENIPIGARIIMIADTLDAMTTDRPYRKALGFEQVVGELRKYSGRQFDPRIAEVLIRSSSIRRMIGAGEADSPPIVPVATFGGRFAVERSLRGATHYRKLREEVASGTKQDSPTT